MIFALLTLLTALSLAAVAGWFSIVGFMAIYAGAPAAALIMGAVTEAAKLVTISWIYRNWKYANWRLKAPLIYFTIALMVATSIGVFGFLSKGHLEQGASTIDNSARIETLNYQINREKALIADNEKVISQLDSTVNSFLGKDRIDRSLSVRKSQTPQRKQLRDNSDAAQKRIDTLSKDKFVLESEIRKLQLDVGPIRYIAELFYGVEENSTKNIESAVRIFTLLIVSTLDPLAVILLIAANHTLLRLRNEKEKTIPQAQRTAAPSAKTTVEEGNGTPPFKDTSNYEEIHGASENGLEAESDTEENSLPIPIFPEIVGLLNEEKNTIEEEVVEFRTALQSSTSAVEENIYKDPISSNCEISKNISSASTNTDAEEKIPEINNEEIIVALGEISVLRNITLPLATIRQPNPTQVDKNKEYIDKSETGINGVEELSNTVLFNDSIVRELQGNTPHFIPQKVNERKIKEVVVGNSSTISIQQEIVSSGHQTDKYPKVLSWLTEFKRA